MFENMTKRVCHTWFAFFGNSLGVVEGQHFYQATQNGTQTAIIFVNQTHTFLRVLDSDFTIK